MSERPILAIFFDAGGTLINVDGRRVCAAAPEFETRFADAPPFGSATAGVIVTSRFLSQTASSSFSLQQSRLSVGSRNVKSPHRPSTLTNNCSSASRSLSVSVWKSRIHSTADASGSASFNRVPPQASFTTVLDRRLF